jgi:hypothetical protein
MSFSLSKLYAFAIEIVTSKKWIPRRNLIAHQRGITSRRIHSQQFRQSDRP